MSENVAHVTDNVLQHIQAHPLCDASTIEISCSVWPFGSPFTNATRICTGKVLAIFHPSSQLTSHLWPSKSDVKHHKI